jgi:CelD/BcsL family acetyltransferase involved in cellulose biosynthesis
MSLRVRRIDTYEGFQGLRATWTALAAESARTSPFFSHDWFACCWVGVSSRHRPEILVVEYGGQPVAVVPLMCSAERRPRRLPTRVLGFLEAPDTPVVDVLAAGEIGPVVDAVLRSLRDRRDWDIVRLRKVVDTSATLKALEGEPRPGMPVERVATTISPLVTLAGTWDDYFRTQKSQRFRKTCRNVESRLRRAGEVTVEEHRALDPDGPVYAEVMEVSRQSWKGARGLAIATMEGMPRFFRELTLRASANGWLHVWILRLDGRAVATEYQLVAEGRVNALRADFDPAFSELSPGAYLNHQILQQLFERGDCHEYDMGPGDNEYKLRWATGQRELATARLFSPSAYGRALHVFETRVGPLVRDLRDVTTATVARLRNAAASVRRRREDPGAPS